MSWECRRYQDKKKEISEQTREEVEGYMGEIIYGEKDVIKAFENISNKGFLEGRGVTTIK